MEHFCIVGILTVDISGRGSELKEQEILSVLNLLYTSIDALDLASLCIVKGESCWLLNIDVLYIQCGGKKGILLFYYFDI